MNNSNKTPMYINIKPFFNAYKIYVLIAITVIVISVISGSLSKKYELSQTTTELR